LLLLFDTLVFGASDFWNKKESSAWSEEELQQLKTKSPWAKKIHAELAGGGANRGGGGGGADSGGGSGSFGGDSSGGSGGRGGGGGGRGGRGGGGGEGGGGMQQQQGPEVVVRWENATPVLEATKLQLPAELADHYAIGVTGLPPQMLAAMLSGGGRGRGQGRNGGRDGAAPAEAPSPEDPAARQKAAIERLLHSASLTAKGRDPQAADLVRQAFNNQTLIFGFPRQSFPLEASDKDVQFVMKLGALTVKAKFEPKEMTYKGGLAV
jgi:hypothetical protein